MKEKIDIKKIDQLNQRASKVLEIKEVYLNDDFFKSVIKFIEEQDLKPINKIIKLLYLSGNEQFPVGKIMFNKKDKKIVGFMGTYFSTRTEENKRLLFCNIHSWIVVKSFRLYSYYLISDLLNKDISLTAFTPIQPLKGLLLKLGFKKFFVMEYLILKISIFNLTKNKFKILNDETEIIQNLDKKTKLIFKNYYDDIYHKLFLKDDFGENSFIIGTKVKKKGFNVFKILYVSNTKIFQLNYNAILNIIGKRFRVLFISKYSLENEDCTYLKSKTLNFTRLRDLYSHTSHQIKSHDILNSDLIL